MNVSDLITKAAALPQFRSEAALGRAVGFSQNAIWHARRAGRVSAEMASRIHEATAGEVPKWELRPDLWARPAPPPVSTGTPQVVSPASA